MDIMLRALTAALGTALGLPLTLSAQPAQPMPRDRASVVREGTATVTGRVVDGLTRSAIPRARVRINGSGGPRPIAVTDASGNFSFAKLPAGSYMLQVEKPTYLPTRYPDAGRTMRSRMQPIVIHEGQSVSGVTVPLFRGSAIVGRVVDAHGDPVEHTSVQALRLPASGSARPTMRAGATTDDLGEFRIPRLEPGAYLLLAVNRRMGREEPSTTEPPAPQPLPTYYPGVLAVDQAQPITVERGQSATGIELVLVEGMPTIVTGNLVTADGQPVTQNGYVNARLPQGEIGMEIGGAGLRPDGTFRLPLAPGEYVLEARAVLRGTGEQSREEERYGTVRLTVGNSPVEPVTIVVGREATVTGRIVFEGTTPPPPPPTSPVWLPLNSPDGTMCRSRPARVNADWTFRVEGLVGTCVAPFQPSFGPWTLKGVLANDEDLLTKPVTFEPGLQLRDVRVVFTDRRTSMTFRVVDETGQATREYVALVFSTEKSQWIRGPYVRTYVPPQVVDGGPPVLSGAAAPVTSATPSLSPERAHTLGAVMPAEYYVVAVDDIEAEDVRAPAVLERLIPSALRVTVPEGSATEVALRRVKFLERR